jgi:hypothetical protein
MPAARCSKCSARTCRRLLCSIGLNRCGCDPSLPAGCSRTAASISCSLRAIIHARPFAPTSPRGGRRSKRAARWPATTGALTARFRRLFRRHLAEDFTVEGTCWICERRLSALSASARIERGPCLGSDDAVRDHLALALELTHGGFRLPTDLAIGIELQQPLDPRVAQVGLSATIWTIRRRISVSTSQRPARVGYVHLGAINCRCHHSMVSRVTIVTTSRSICGPRQYARAASRRRSSSVRRRRRHPAAAARGTSPRSGKRRLRSRRSSPANR